MLDSADSVCTRPHPAFDVVVCTTSVRYSTGIAPRIVKPGIVRLTVAEPLESDVYVVVHGSDDDASS